MVTSSPAVKKRGVTRRTIRFFLTITLFTAAPTLVSRVTPRAVARLAVKEFENLRGRVRPHGVNRLVHHAQAEFGRDGLVRVIARGDGVGRRLTGLEFGFRRRDLDLQLLLHGRNRHALGALVELAVEHKRRTYEKVGRILRADRDLHGQGRLGRLDYLI